MVLRIAEAMMVAQEMSAEEVVGRILLGVEGIVVVVGEEGSDPEPVARM